MLIVLAAWTCLAFVYRRAEKTDANRQVMAVFMGLAVFVLNLAVLAVRGESVLAAHWSQFALGALNGLCAVAGLPIFMAAVRRGDLSVTWTILTLSFAPTSIAVILYPGEEPTAAGVIGLCLAAAAIVLLGFDMMSRRGGIIADGARKGWGTFMSLAFLTNTFSLYLYTIGEHCAPDDTQVHRSAFLASFGFALALGSLIVSLAARCPGSKAAGTRLGLAGGLFMFAGSFFTLLALSAGRVPGYVLYPATNGGSSVLVVLLSVLLLKERPGIYGWCGIAVGALSLVLFGAAA